MALLQSSGLLTSDVKLLSWGQPYEYEVRTGGWLEQRMCVTCHMCQWWTCT